MLLGLLLFSCQKETPVVVPPLPIDQVALAKAYFDRSVPNTKFQTDTVGKNHRQRLTKKPDWERALVRETEGGYEVWAPLIYEQNLTAYNDNGEMIYRLNDRAFLRIVNEKGRFANYGVLLYLSGNERAPTPLTQDAYEGVVLVEDWYGKPLASHTQGPGGTNPSPGGRQVETTWECTTTRWYTCGVNRNGERVNCHLTDVEVDCVPIGGGNQYLVFPPEQLGGGGGSGGYTGGGGSGSGNTPPSPKDVRIQIANKPFALYDDIPCEIIKKWIALAKSQPSTQITDKLKTIIKNHIVSAGTGAPGFNNQEVAQVQNINDAYSTVVNMDYFPITVTQLPIVNGKRLTAPQFLQHIRKNINSFVDTDISGFSPYKFETTDDTQLWNSADPTGALVSIDIFMNDGTVITSHSSGSKWTFTTVHDPLNGDHPVSGNRDFGYVANSDGSYTFYTRGVDRLTDFYGTLAQTTAGIPFNDADALWKSFQDAVKQYVDGHGGSAALDTFTNIDVNTRQEEQNTYRYHRPDWELMKKVIDGELPLSTLSTDCPD